MTTQVQQFKINFQEETLTGLKSFSTMWYNVKFFDAKNIIAKYENKEGFEIERRTITKDNNSLKNAIKAKFNN